VDVFECSSFKARCPLLDLPRAIRRESGTDDCEMPR
jgi:hypothetical protein